MVIIKPLTGASSQTGAFYFAWLFITLLQVEEDWSKLSTLKRYCACDVHLPSGQIGTNSFAADFLLQLLIRTMQASTSLYSQNFQLTASFKAGQGGALVQDHCFEN